MCQYLSFLNIFFNSSCQLEKVFLNWLCQCLSFLSIFFNRICLMYKASQNWLCQYLSFLNIFGPLVVAGRVLWNRVWQSFHLSLCLSFHLTFHLVVVLSVTATAFTGWLCHPMSQVTRFAELLFQDKGFFISIDQVWVSYCSHLFFFTFGLFNLRDFVFGLIKGLCFDPVTRLT